MGGRFPKGDKEDGHGEDDNLKYDGDVGDSDIDEDNDPTFLQHPFIEKPDLLVVTESGVLTISRSQQ